MIKNNLTRLEIQGGSKTIFIPAQDSLFSAWNSLVLPDLILKRKKYSIEKQREWSKKSYRKNREKYLLAHKKWNEANRQKHREMDKNYKRNNKEKVDNSIKKWRLKNPLARSAHQKALRAVMAGKILKLPCFICGDKISVAHHSDYSKPLVVLWVCRSHHRKIHLNQNGGKVE
jgi:hypothetical protein